MKLHREPDTIPWDGQTPKELTPIFDDFVAIVNHLIALGLHHKVGLATHYYPLNPNDNSSSPKPIPPDRELRDLAREWFHDHYEGQYQVHYLDSAACFAMARIVGWRRLGGDIAALPYQRKPIIFLNNDLFAIEHHGGIGAHLSVKTAPKQTVSFTASVQHRHFKEWSNRRPSSLIIIPDGIRITYADKSRIPHSPGIVAYDFNFDRAVFARSDGEQREVDLSKIAAIQQAHRKKRESIQQTMRHNPAKAERLVSKTRGREHDRVNDRLHKTIHGKSSAIAPFIDCHRLGVEDLSKTTRDILKDDRGKRFNSRLSSWIHGSFEAIIQHHHPNSEEYYTRGTSRYCPFDNTPLTHPEWRQSYCSACKRTYDRDRLESIHGLIRTMPPRHMKGKPWKTAVDVLPENIVERLRHQSTILILHYDGSGGSSPFFEQRIWGLPQAAFSPPESVHPECADLYPEAQSATDTGASSVVQGNRSEASSNPLPDQKWSNPGTPQMSMWTRTETRAFRCSDSIRRVQNQYQPVAGLNSARPDIIRSASCISARSVTWF